MTLQGLFKDNIIFFKYYRIDIWCIVIALFCYEITCHTPNYRPLHVENTDHLISSDGRFDDEVTKSP